MNLVDSEMAARVARLGFPEGGYRICRKCKKNQKASMEAIAEWIEKGTPDCRICGSRTELLSPREFERLK